MLHHRDGSRYCCTMEHGLQERNGILNYSTRMEAGSGRQWNIHFIMDSWRGMEHYTTRRKQVLLDHGIFLFWLNERNKILDYRDGTR
jgi:hypothetical protein